MFVTLDACNIGTERELVLNYSDRCYPDANVFRIFVQRLRQTRSEGLVPAALVNALASLMILIRGDTTITSRFVERPLWQIFRDFRIYPEKFRDSSRNLLKIPSVHVLSTS
jgi:hypothetical protein